MRNPPARARLPLHTARDNIAEWEKQVAGGKKKVAAGKRRLTAGQQRFDRASWHLTLARGVRIFCAVLAAFLVALSIFLRFFRKWRLSQNLEK